MAGVKRSWDAMLGMAPSLLEPQSPGLGKFDTVSVKDSATPSHKPNHEVSNFSTEASVILVGIRGSGKSTLAVMASSAMKRKIIDMENVFQRENGMTSQRYRKNKGVAQCAHEQAILLRKTLELNRINAIVVCSWMDRSIQAILREFKNTNPVIHIVRDSLAIQKHLKIDDDKTLHSLLSVSNAAFRTCSNFEFFNVSETPISFSDAESSDGESTPRSQSARTPYLTLKQAERHLLKFLSRVFAPGAIPFTDSAFPLATVPLEGRLFTYALEVPLSSILNGEVDVEEEVTGADAIKVVVRPGHAGTSEEERGEEYFSLMNSLTRGIGILRRSSVVPIIVHVVYTSKEALPLYLDVVAHALRLAPEMVTVNLFLEEPHILRLKHAKKRAELVGVCQVEVDPPAWDSPFWSSMYRKATMLGFDMVHFERPAITFEDNIKVNQLRASISSVLDQRKPALIAYNSGWLGRHSACFNPTLTDVAPSNHRGFVHHSRPPHLTAFEATQALQGAFVIDPMKLYVFGAKVDYSASPVMHNAALQACGLPHRYTPFSSKTLSGVRHLIEDPNFGGASIGLPFKVEIITLTQALSRHARAIGAANTLIPIRQVSADDSIPEGATFFNNVNKAGPVKALYGDNTDWIGIRACIRRGLSPANAVRSSTCGLVIGAGGMARAAVYAMLQVGVRNIGIYNRTTAHAEKMVNHFQDLLRKDEWKSLGGGSETRFFIVASPEEAWPADLRPATIFISCIPTHQIGDVPAPDFTLPDAWLASKTGGVIIELGYKDLNTPMLVQARALSSKGWVALDGLDLLPEQGFAQFELFTGRRAPRRVMRRSLLEGYRDEQGRSNLDELQQRLQLAND